MENEKPKGFVISRENLSDQFPTHKHSPEFWEYLGRTVATYGFLEEVLRKAIFTFTATVQYAADETDEAYEAWHAKLEKTLTNQLWNLAEDYRKAVCNNPKSTIQNLEELTEDIKESSTIRNVICHGSWRPPDSEGKSVPLFVNRQIQVFQTAIDVEFLKQTQTHVADLACSVIDTVTAMGCQFPGSTGPGEQVV